MRKKVITRYLELKNREDFKPSPHNKPHGVELKQAKIPCPELNRFLYTAVGGNWFWIDRLPWSYKRWMSYLSNPELDTWIAYCSGTPAGYYELEIQNRNDVELVYFGVLPLFIGKGLGGYLISEAVKRSWEMGGKRIWLHTCSLDHPNALKNYRARGFKIFKEETSTVTVPDKSPGPW